LSRPHRSRSILSVCNAGLKLALVGLLAFAAARQDLPQFHGKSMTGRAVAYPVAALIVPVAWWLTGRRRPYPHLVDMLVVAPFVIDMLGNATNLYDTVSWWDDANHFVNWAILTAAIALLLRRANLSRWPLFGIAVGFGAVTAIVWELLEYVTFIRNSPELATAYTDTLGDLTLGLSGSIVAAALVARLA
jgi:hypothetical protein